MAPVLRKLSAYCDDHQGAPEPDWVLTGRAEGARLGRPPKPRFDCSVTHCTGSFVGDGPFCNNHRIRANRFNLSRDRALELFNQRTCDICGSSPEKLAIDHDHACCPESSQSCGNCIRGVLCLKCNSILGMVNEETGHLEAMILYLRLVD